MEQGEVVVRGAGAADVTALAEVFVEARRANVPAIPPLAHPESTVGPFLAGVLEEDEVWVAEADGTVLAFLALGPAGELDHLYARPGATGRGIGSTLLARAKEASPSGLALWTFAANTRARQFYARHGFVETGGTDGDNEEKAPDVRMEWRPEG